MTDEAGSRPQKRCRDRGGALSPPLAGRVGERVSPQRDTPPEERTIARRARTMLRFARHAPTFPASGRGAPSPQRLVSTQSHRAPGRRSGPNRCQLSTTRRLPSKSRKTGSGFSPFAPCLARHPRLLTPPTTGACPFMAPSGEVAEWLNAPHSKCGIGASLSGVRIPPSPP